MTYPSYASPDSAPSPEGSPPGESLDEPIAPADDPHASLLQLPWCQTCGPFIRMLFSYARERAQLQGRRTGTAAEMLPQSPFADYVVVPALVHRSQLGMYSLLKYHAVDRFLTSDSLERGLYFN